MKAGSLTDKEIGDTVEKGEFLGIVASSGCSTNIHLHFEIYDEFYEVIDPFNGDCNVSPDFWWAIQPDYREPKLNIIFTHDDIPEEGCPQINENPHFQNDFYPGDILYSAFYFKDATAGSEADFEIKRPNGTVWQSWSLTIPETWDVAWWYWEWELPTESLHGVWTLEATYMEETIIHDFNYGVYANLEHDFSELEVTLVPNPSKNGLISITNLNAKSDINIFDTSGKLVKDLTTVDGTLDLSDLVGGMYYVSIKNVNGMTTKKLVLENH